MSEAKSGYGVEEARNPYEFADQEAEAPEMVKEPARGPEPSAPQPVAPQPQAAVRPRRGRRAEAQKARGQGAEGAVRQMEAEYERVLESERDMGQAKRAKLVPELEQMKAALEAAKVTAASEERNREEQRMMESDAYAAGHSVNLLRGQRNPYVAKTLNAEQKVRQIEKALSQAKRSQVQKKLAYPLQTKLDKLGVNTGEDHRQWGDETFGTFKP